MSKHTPEPWAMDKAKWGACQWGAMPDDARGEPNCSAGVLPVIVRVPCENDDHVWYVRPRREDQQERTIGPDESVANAERICACVNALRGLDVAKVKALLDACRASEDARNAYESNRCNDTFHAAMEAFDVSSKALDALRDSIRAGGGQ